jgi:hypothetical protein
MAGPTARLRVFGFSDNPPGRRADSSSGLRQVARSLHDVASGHLEHTSPGMPTPPRKSPRLRPNSSPSRPRQRNSPATLVSGTEYGASHEPALPRRPARMTVPLLAGKNRDFPLKFAWFVVKGAPKISGLRAKFPTRQPAELQRSAQRNCSGTRSGIAGERKALTISALAANRILEDEGR